MRAEGDAEKLLEQAAGRLALRPHPPLFDDDVALLVELAEDRLREALGLEVGEELEFVGGQRVVVGGGVGAGAGVETDAALARDQLVELVRLDVLLRRGLFLLELLLEPLELPSASGSRLSRARCHSR